MAKPSWIVVTCALLAGCASGPSRFELSRSQVQAAYDNAPWIEGPDDLVISPVAYTTGRCVRTRDAHAVCLYRSRYPGQRQFSPLLAQAMVLSKDGGWIFDLASPNVHANAGDCQALAAVLATYPRATRRVSRMMVTTRLDSAGFGTDLIPLHLEAKIERHREALAQAGPDAVMDCRFPPRLGVRVEDRPEAWAGAPLLFHVPARAEDGWDYVEIDHELRLAGGAVTRRRDLLRYRQSSEDYEVIASMPLGAASRQVRLGIE